MPLAPWQKPRLAAQRQYVVLNNVIINGLQSLSPSNCDVL